ncbi:MAG: class I SAM-dependent methyltransferase [Candidatus Binatia bacterium]
MSVNENILEVHRHTATVEGWLSEKEGPYLYSLAQLASKLGCIVEIGSWKGKSTIWLAKGSQAIGGEKVYAVDPHTPDGSSERDFRENIKKAGVESIVVPMVMASIEVLQGWDKPIGLLWVDGDHKYRGVQSDFFGWYPHVVPGGVIALHDTLNRRGVRKFVQRHIRRLARQHRVDVLGQVDEILAVKKVQPLSGYSRAKRSLIVGREYLFHRGHSRARYFTNLGKHYLRSGDYQKARQCFRLAFSYQPLNWKNLRRWGLSYLPGLLNLYVHGHKGKGPNNRTHSNFRGPAQ